LAVSQESSALKVHLASRLKRPERPPQASPGQSEGARPRNVALGQEFSKFLSPVRAKQASSRQRVIHEEHDVRPILENCDGLSGLALPNNSTQGGATSLRLSALPWAGLWWPFRPFRTRIQDRYLRWVPRFWSLRHGRVSPTLI
jgi:hypothetical protein